MNDPGLAVGAQGEAVSRLQESLGQACLPDPAGGDNQAILRARHQERGQELPARPRPARQRRR